MKPIDGLVIGSLQDYDPYREDIEQQEGVVFAQVPGGPRGADRGGDFGSEKLLETLPGALDEYRPGRALFLSPYRGMAADVARLMDSGVDVRTTGPLPVRSRDLHPPIAELHRSDPNFRVMSEASRHTDFGDPVYLRIISSPEGGKWSKWWCAFRSCRMASALLDAPLRRIYVAVAGKAARMHVTITLKTDRNSTGHLLVAPNVSRLQGDLFLLGTGGTLTDDSLLNQPGMYGKSDYRMLSRPARRRLADLWHDDAMISLDRDEQRFYRHLLRAIGNSAGSGKGICLEYPVA